MLRRPQHVWRAKPCQPSAKLGLRQGPQSRQQSTSSRNDATTPSPNSASHGTITTSSPQSTTIDHLLAELRNARSQAREGSGKDGPSLLALFLTPAFARHALDADLPLRAFQELRGSRQHDKELRTVTAVVDRVPDLNFVGNGGNPGAEGMAYIYMSCLNADEEPLLSSHRLQSQDTASSKQLTQSVPGTVSFRVSPELKSRPQTVDLQMPLAQTIFSTGKISTMTSALYVPDGGHGNTLVLSSQPSLLDAQLLPLPFTSSANILRPQFPFKALTRPRTVHNCMGNIVRTLSSTLTDFDEPSATPTHGPSQPASTELETAVKNFFDEHSLPPKPVQVWALILPSDLAARSAPDDPFARSSPLWKKQRILSPGPVHPKDLQQGLMRLLMLYGARLCRVLSGGGGWGKKAGLLSLDPDVDFSGNTNMSNSEPDFTTPAKDSELEYEKNSALGEIVKEGESIMFFIGPPSSAYIEDSDEQRKYDSLLATPSLSSSASQRARSTILGSLPSSVDAMPTPAGGPADSAAAPEIHHFDDVFGALSEGGLAATIDTPSNSRTPAMVTQTKIDVPFSTLIFASGTFTKQPMRFKDSHGPETQEEGSVFKSQPKAPEGPAQPEHTRSGHVVRKVAPPRFVTHKMGVKQQNQHLYNGDGPFYNQRSFSTSSRYLGDAKQSQSPGNETSSKNAARLSGRKSVRNKLPSNPNWDFTISKELVVRFAEQHQRLRSALAHLCNPSHGLIDNADDLRPRYDVLAAKRARDLQKTTLGRNQWWRTTAKFLESLEASKVGVVTADGSLVIRLRELVPTATAEELSAKEGSSHVSPSPASRPARDWKTQRKLNKILASDQTPAPPAPPTTPGRSTQKKLSKILTSDQKTPAPPSHGVPPQSPVPIRYEEMIVVRHVDPEQGATDRRRPLVRPQRHTQNLTRVRTMPSSLRVRYFDQPEEPDNPAVPDPRSAPQITTDPARTRDLRRTEQEKLKSELWEIFQDEMREASRSGDGEE
ncbi:uncharacterized protein LTR77_005099 [Saxophila tyrrhenica]|uniref:Uncharacterized protein n=1 Tax=Saxophila tyrrhenica TaxID=1690608 RepID=A0AAV9PB24_9PEZI|nr:hypothetical protein LTR77_005099 [Saxophila tyrrhenica]